MREKSPYWENEVWNEGLLPKKGGCLSYADFYPLLLKRKFALVLIRKEYTRASSGGQNTRIQDTFLSFHSVQCGESNCILFEVGAQEHTHYQGQKRLDTKAFYYSSRHSIQDLAHFLFSASLFFRLNNAILLYFYPTDAIFIPKHKHQKISPFLFLRA